MYPPPAPRTQELHRPLSHMAMVMLMAEMMPVMVPAMVTTQVPGTMPSI